jgi:hypothetical protein
MPTLEAFESAVRNAFLQQPEMNIDFVTLSVLPDYSFLKSHVDPFLSMLYKKEDTQHQWTFQAAVPSPLFPLGCKTTFRAYSSDLVTELHKTPKLNCLTRLGRLTGTI